jgi:hypothetical protein
VTSPVIVDGDSLAFDNQFGNRVVTIIVPSIIHASGHATIANKKVCIQGDEAKVQLSATYKTASHTVEGTGTVTIKALDNSQVASGCHSGGALITEGKAKFTASFTPLIPATMPPPASTPDVTTPSSGYGNFKPSQNWVNGG